MAPRAGGDGAKGGPAQGLGTRMWIMTDFCCRCRRLKPSATATSDASFAVAVDVDGGVCFAFFMLESSRQAATLNNLLPHRPQTARSAPRLAVVAPLAAFYLFIYLWVLLLLLLPLCNVCKWQEYEKVRQGGRQNNRRTCHSKPSTSNHQKAFNNTPPQPSIHLSLVNVAVAVAPMLPLLQLLLLRHQRKCYVQCSFGHFDFGGFPKRQREKKYRDPRE